MANTTVDEGLTSGRLLARNSLLNLSTGGLVLILNIIFVPLMLESFGLELYGVLSITWMVLGHMRWLDLGFSAACTKFVAQDIARGRESRAGQWAWTAVTVQLAVGVIAAAGLWWAADPLAGLLQVDPARRSLVVMALQMFALVVPVDLAARSLNAVLEAKQRFDWINSLTLAGAAWTFSTYGIGIARGGDFTAVVFGLVLLRVANLAATFWLARRALPSLSRTRLRLGRILDGVRAREMFQFGGWVSISNGIGPLIFFFDRWVISAMRGVGALPIYTVPLQMLVSLQMIPASISSTLFPAFSMLQAKTRWNEVQDLVLRTHRYLLLGLLPIFSLVFMWAPEILRLWIDQEFATQAALPFRILIVGFSIGLFAPFSGVLLQGAGRPDVLSKIYLIEAPINILMTVVLVREWGVVGAAIAYSVRTIVETLILWACVHYLFPLSGRRFVSGTLARTGPALAAFAVLIALFPTPSVHNVAALGITAGVTTAYGLLLHFHFLDASDRSFVRSLLTRRGAKAGVQDR